MTRQPGMQRMLAQLEKEFNGRLSEEQASQLTEFSRQVFASFILDDIKGRELEDLYGFCLDGWLFLQHHNSEKANIRVFNPEFKKHGWQLGHTVVRVLAKNTPFITDSVRGEFNRRNITIHTIHSSILSLVRDKDGNLVELLPPRSTISAPDGEQWCEEALLCPGTG